MFFGCFSGMTSSGAARPLDLKIGEAVVVVESGRIGELTEDDRSEFKPYKVVFPKGDYQWCNRQDLVKHVKDAKRPDAAPAADTQEKAAQEKEEPTGASPRRAEPIGASPRRAESSRTEDAKSQQQFRSLAEVSQALAEITAKLDSADSSYVPWGEIGELRQQLDGMQQAIGQHIETESRTANIFASPSTRRSQQHRRKSLTEVSQKLTELGTSLESAETSWSPWVELADAKQQLGQAWDIVGQPDAKLMGA